MIDFRRQLKSAVIATLAMGFGLVASTAIAASAPQIPGNVGKEAGPGTSVSFKPEVEPAEQAAPRAAENNDRLRGTDALRQLADEPLEKLQPREPLDDDDIRRIDAMALFMSGQLKEARGDSNAALEAYRKAIALDPKSVEIYRALVPLEFSEGDAELAVKYALKAVELDPNDYRLLHQLGRHMAVRGRPEEALQLLEKATESSELTQKSPANVILHSHLAILYSVTGAKEKAADAYKVVFDGLVNPDEYQLDFQSQAALLNDDNTSFERIGQAFLDAGRTELAIDAFERAAKSRRSKPGALSYNLARVYLQTGKSEKALAELQKYFNAQLQSKGQEAYQLLAEILTKLDKSDELLPRLEKIAEKDTHNAPLQHFLAQQYLANDQTDKAEELFKRVIDESKDVDGYVGLASVYRRQHNPRKLLESLIKAVQGGKQLEGIGGEVDAVAQDEELLESVIAVGREMAADENTKLDFAGNYIIGKLALTGEKTDAASEFYRRAIEQARDQRALVLYNELGEHLLLTGKFSEAVDLYDQAAHDSVLRQIRPIFLYRLSQAHEFNGETEKALETVREAQKLRPNLPLLVNQEAWIYYHSRNFDKAIPMFEKVIADFPEETDLVHRARLSLSSIHVERGDLEKGEKVLEEILAEHPDDPSVNNDLGYLYADQGKHLEKAEKMIRLALDSEPDNAAYLDSMGWVLFRRDKFEEALPYLQKAAEQPTGSDPTILDHLGDCYDRLGKTDEAIETWQKALDKANESAESHKDIISKIEKKVQDAKEDNDQTPSEDDS